MKDFEGIGKYLDTIVSYELITNPRLKNAMKSRMRQTFSFWYSEAKPGYREAHSGTRRSDREHVDKHSEAADRHKDAHQDNYSNRKDLKDDVCRGQYKHSDSSVGTCCGEETRRHRESFGVDMHDDSIHRDTGYSETINTGHSDHADYFK